MLKQESKGRLQVSNDYHGYKPVLKYQKFEPHKEEAPSKKKKRFQSVDRTKVEGSTFGKVGAQTLSCALKGRMIISNSYGMEKETAKVFKSPNKGEAKQSILRSPHRDYNSVERDNEIL